MLNFIRRERIYILMLFFMLAINMMNPGHVEEKHYDKEASLSTKTFEEIGVTREKVKEFFESGELRARFFKYALILGFIIFIASLVLNISFIFRRKKIDLKTLAHQRSVPWGISDLVRASIIIVFSGYLMGILEGFIFKLCNINIGLNLRMMLNTFFMDIVVVAVIFYLVIVKYKERLEVLGLRAKSIFRNIVLGLSAYIFILPLLFVVLILSMWLLNLLGYSPPPQPVFEAFMEERRTRVLFFLTIFVSLFGPIIEEVFFRGFMYSVIRKRLGVLTAAFLSASIFSLLHTNIAGFLPIMTLGVLLAYLYEATGSLTASITVHIVHNSIIVGFMFFIKEFVV